MEQLAVHLVGGSVNLDRLLDKPKEDRPRNSL